jgi:hypothetical protein
MTKKIFLICMMFLVTISIGLCSFSYRIDIKNNLIKLIKKSQISSNLNTGTINKNNETKKYTPSPYSAKKIINEDNLPKNIVKSNKPEISLNILMVDTMRTQSGILLGQKPVMDCHQLE